MKPSRLGQLSHAGTTSNASASLEQLFKLGGIATADFEISERKPERKLKWKTWIDVNFLKDDKHGTRWCRTRKQSPGHPPVGFPANPVSKAASPLLSTATGASASHCGGRHNPSFDDSNSKRITVPQYQRAPTLAQLRREEQHSRSFVFSARLKFRRLPPAAQRQPRSIVAPALSAHRRGSRFSAQ